jgi:hypothetical protein
MTIRDCATQPTLSALPALFLLLSAGNLQADPFLVSLRIMQTIAGLCGGIIAGHVHPGR